MRNHAPGEVGCRGTLSFGATTPLHEMSCICAFPSRYRIPCKHVLAVCKHEGQKVKSFELVDPGYQLATYRQLNSDPEFAVNLPVWDNLGPDGVASRGACRPGQESPRKKKRLRSNGELNSDSRYDTPLSELNGRNPAGGGAASVQGGARGVWGTVRGVGIPIGEGHMTRDSGCGRVSQGGDPYASGGGHASSAQGSSQGGSQAAL